jgi:hydrogenase small subunit
MSEITRRHFFKLSAKMAALMGLGATALPKIAQALEQMAAGTAPILWLQGQSCSGCSVSFLDSDEPEPLQVLTRYISLKFHSSLSTATGKTAMRVLNDTIAAGKYFLVVEGAVPAAMPEACVVGHEPFTKQVVRAAQNAQAVIAVGACAAYGGLPAAENNPTGSMGVPDYLKKQGVQKPTILLPGCPAHPDWIIGTLVHALQFGLPNLDAKGRPQMFFNRSLHDQCQRFSDYERENFAKTFADEGCFFKLGCLGPITRADCNLRLWNGGTNTCIKAGAPCIGCASEDFGRKASFPFYRKNELQNKGNIVS